MSMNQLSSDVVDLGSLAPVPCPCGQARRAFGDRPGSAISLHVVDIEREAELHHHDHHTEVYYVLDCESGACIELDGVRHPLQPGRAVYISPGVRHRAIGRMQILNIVAPPFDANDEHLD